MREGVLVDRFEPPGVLRVRDGVLDNPFELPGVFRVRERRVGRSTRATSCVES